MPKVKYLYAWIVANKDPDDEGVPAVELAHAGKAIMLPLMGTDQSFEHLRMRKLAQATANELGHPIKLMRSTGLEVTEIIKPEKNDAKAN